MDKKEANLLPRFCTSYNDSSSSEESSDESAESDNETKYYGLQKKDSNISGIRKLQKKVKKKQSKWTTYTSRFKRFCNSPRVHFVYEKTFFVVFLMLFSYMILCEFTYYDQVELIQNDTQQITARSFVNATTENFTNVPFINNPSSIINQSMINDNLEPDNITFVKIIKKVVKRPSWVEYLLIYWMFALLAEEGRQVYLFCFDIFLCNFNIIFLNKK